MRQYIRHPADIPIELVASDSGPTPRLLNVGAGGLELRTRTALAPARVVTVRIACVEPPFSAAARVAWCRTCKGGFILGLAFIDEDDAFRARMAEQVCHIEHYRRRQLRAAGRRMTAEDAAREWIERKAARFAAAWAQT